VLDRIIMPHFIRLTTFTSEGAKDLRNFGRGRKQFLEAAGKLKIKVISEYVITGRYDIITILDAPDLEAVLKLSAMMGSTGRTRNETYGAVSADEFEKITQSI
jgi:uncharacterized protein with GYD domain